MKSLEGKRILVSEPLPDMFEAAERLKELGAEVDFGEMIFVRDKKLNAEQMKQVVKEYDGFIAMSREKFPREVLQEATRLAVIGKYGIGVDHIDMEAATEYGVLVTNCPDNRASVAEPFCSARAECPELAQSGAHLLGNRRKSHRSSGCRRDQPPGGPAFKRLELQLYRL